MAVFRVTCPACNVDAELGVRDLTVLVCLDNGEGSYTYRCPRCGAANGQRTYPRIIDLLVSGGVSRVEWHLPAELQEPHTGDPIAYDDLLTFHDTIDLELAALYGAQGASE